jgi:alkylated DNA nucleotide flippase Atl1
VSPDPEDYVERVLSIVEEVPRGRVTSYGAIAAAVGGGPRQVGAVMSRHGGPVPWWRVVRADGSLPPSHEDGARPHYLEEGTPLRASGAVDMVRAFWDPLEPPVEKSRRAVDKPGWLVDDAVEPEECSRNPLRSGSPEA